MTYLFQLDSDSEQLDPVIKQAMDQLIEDLMTSGDEDLFSQIIFYIMSENVSGESASGGSRHHFVMPTVTRVKERELVF